MKKRFVVGLALLIGFAFVTCGFAQTTTEKATKAATDVADKAKASGESAKAKAVKTTEKATPAPAPAAAPAQATPAPEKKAEKKETTKAKAQRAKGEVTAIDLTAKNMTIKGKKGEMSFDLATAKMKKEPKVGDKVFVKYTEADGKMVAKFVSTAKKHHKPHKKAEKKEAAPAAPEQAPAK